jgi:septal ring factor EnvC (AmiA/AmiB activator)
MPAIGARQARPSPLPWMLLTVSIAMTIGVLILGKSRLDDERLRTATALKANDEMKGQLKNTNEQLDAAKASCSEVEANGGELQKQLLSQELTIRRLQDELTRLKAAKGTRK